MRYALFAISFTLVAAMAGVSLAQDQPEPASTEGTIDAVTIYRGQAMVTRRIELPQRDQPVQRIIVDSLPAEIVGDSIYAEASGELTVRSVRYRTRPVREDVRKQVRQLDDKIQQLQRQIAQIEITRETLNNQQQLLDKLANFTPPTMQWDLSHGVLEAKPLKSVTNFIFDQKRRIASERLNLRFEKEDMQQRLEQAQRERATLTDNASTTKREAVVFIGDDANGGKLELRYLVKNATWSPSYNLRGPNSRETVQLEYLASVRQTSGEDWNNVKMTLSTASPSLVAEPPELASVALTLTQQQARRQAQQAGRMQRDGYQQRKAKLAEQQQQVQQQRAQKSTGGGGGGDRGGLFGAEQTAPSQSASADAFDTKLNVLSAQQQLLDIVAGRAKRGEQRETKPKRDAQQASVRYELAGRTSLPSRSDRQLVRITDKRVEADFYRIARPVLSAHVYQQAKLTNTLDWILLSGPSNSYLAGQFVGRGSVPTVSVGETFTVGFGIDSALQTQRELLEREETTQGGNQVARITYRLSIANFADQQRQVRLFDRVPVPKRSADVQVELLDFSQEPAKSPANDAGAIEAGSDGIIRWDVTVPAQATGDKALTVDYTFTMEYDKQKRLDINANKAQ